MNIATIARPLNLTLPEHLKWQKCLLLAGLVWALVVVVPDFFRLTGNLASFGFSSDNDGRIYEVDMEGGPATSQGLTIGDTIPLTDNSSGDSSRDLQGGACSRMDSSICRDYLAIFGGMGGLAYVQHGTVIHLPVTGRDKPVTLAAMDAPLDGLAKVLLLFDECVAVFVLYRAFNLAWTRMDAMTTGFFLYVMWFNPGQYFYFYALLQPHAKLVLLQEAFQAIAQGAGYAGFLIFALRFPHNRTEPQFQNLEKLAIGLGAVLTLLQLLSFANVFGHGTEQITRAAIGGGYAVACYGFYIVWRRTKLQAPIDFQRMRWVLWGCALGIPAFVFADSNEATSLWARYVWNWHIWAKWSPPESMFEFAFLISGVFAILICEAIRRPRIVNVSIALRSFFAVAVAVGASGLLEKFLGDWLSAKQASSVGQWPTWAAVTFVGALASHKGVDWSRELISGRLHQAIEQLRKAGAAAAGANAVEDVDAALANAAVEAFDLTFAAVLRQSGEDFCLVYPPDYDAVARPLISLTVDQLADLRIGRVVQLGTHKPISADIALSTPTLAVPVIAGPRLEAVVLYGPHKTGADIDSLEAEALKNFAQETAVGYETARMTALEAEVTALRQQLAGKQAPEAKPA